MFRLITGGVTYFLIRSRRKCISLVPPGSSCPDGLGIIEVNDNYDEANKTWRFLCQIDDYADHFLLEAPRVSITSFFNSLHIRQRSSLVGVKMNVTVKVLPGECPKKPYRKRTMINGVFPSRFRCEFPAEADQIPERRERGVLPSESVSERREVRQEKVRVHQPLYGDVLRADALRPAAVRPRAVRTDGNRVPLPVPHGLHRSDLRRQIKAVRAQPVRGQGRLHRQRKNQLLPLPMSRVVGRAAMREEDDAHSVQAAVREDAPGAVLARPDHGVCRSRRDRDRLVREAALPGETGETPGGGGGQTWQIE